VNSSRFFNNDMTRLLNVQSGGAIYSEGDIIIDECEFWNNTAVIGGAIYTGDVFSTFECHNSFFFNNTAVRYGGSLFVEGSESVVTSTTFKMSFPVGSGVFVDHDANLLLEECLILNDTVAGGRARFDGGFLVYRSNFSSLSSSSHDGYVPTGAEIEFRSTTIQSDLPTVYLINTKLVLNSVTIIPFNGSSTLQSTPQTIIGNCTNSTIQINSYDYPLNGSSFASVCNTVFSPQPLLNGSAIPIIFNPVDKGNVRSFYYNWQNDDSSEAVTFTLVSSSPTSMTSAMLAVSLASNNSYPTPQNATWISSLSNTANGQSTTNLTLSGLDGSLQHNGLYVVGVIATSYSETEAIEPSSTEFTLITVSQSAVVDLNRTVVQVVPRFAFAGAPFVVNITLFDTWGNALASLGEGHWVRYGNISNSLYPISFWSFNTPSNIGWHPWVVQDIYLDAIAVATITGKILTIHFQHLITSHHV